MPRRRQRPLRARRLPPAGRAGYGWRQRSEQLRVAGATLLLALVVGPAARTGIANASASAAAAGPITPSPSPSIEPAVHDHELLVRFRATGELQRIHVGADQDPVALARELRRRTDLFSSVGANLVVTAAGVRADAAQATTANPTTPASTTPATTDTDITVPSSATVAPPAGLKGWIPNDHVGDVGWASLQWNFVGRFGVDATKAWDVLRRRNPATAGGAGVRVAIVDSGIAYRDRDQYRRSPDIDPARVLAGYDFVDEDRFPDDLSGHGTHVASTIAGATDNNAGLTGLAYNAEILPIRVLDDRDSGDVLGIARGIRYAIRRHADLINLSVDFPVTTTAADIPEVIDALDAARRAGILVIGSSGNEGAGTVAYPARSSSVLAVGATTARGCRSAFPEEGYSNGGKDLGLVAPGGGSDHYGEDKTRCQPGVPGPPIAQVTMMKRDEPSNLGIPLDYVGTSMAAAHVTGVAALVLGSKILGSRPTPDLLAAYLVRSTRDLGPTGWDTHYGAGLIDAEEAVTKVGAAARLRGARRAVATAARKHRRALPIR